VSGPEQVSIGGRPFTVARFKTYKAVLVGEVISRVSRGVMELLREASAFRTQFRAENTLQITRQMCTERAAQLRSSADTARARAVADGLEDGEQEQFLALAEQFEARAAGWERQLADMGDRDYIEMPQDPDENEVILAVFPKAFQMKSQLAELLALVITPDEELRGEWRNDTVHEKLRLSGEDLIENSEPEEIVELAVVAKRVVGDQLRPLAPKFRQLLDLRDQKTQAETPAPQPQPTPSPTPEPTPGSPAPQPPSPQPTSESPDSSMSSQVPTDGDSRTSFSESRGEPLVPSSAT
jgi:hypothetical protein